LSQKLGTVCFIYLFPVLVCLLLNIRLWVPDSNQIHAYSANGGSLYRDTCLHGHCHYYASFYLVSGAAGGAMDAGNLLKPMLGRGELRCIGATTLDEYRKYIEKDAALERRFQQVYCGEPAVEDTISILRGLRERYELHHGVKISDGSLVAAAVLSDRYITGRFLPDKGTY
jgi:hypothetical protein